MSRLLENLPGRAAFDDPAEIEDGRPVRDLTDNREIVRDENRRQTALVPDILQQVENLRLNRDIQCRNRFIEHKEFGIEDQGPGNGNPLPLPS